MAETFLLRHESVFNGDTMQNALKVLQTSDPVTCVVVRAPAVQICRATGRLLLWAATVLSFILTDSAAAAQQSPPPSTPPKFDAVQAAVEALLASDPDYRPNDLLTRSHVSAAVEAARNVGWDVPYSDRIVELALADDSFLVTELSSPTGQKFMRKIGQLPGGYPRLDRLSSISRGQTVVRKLVRQRDGEKFIEYLSTTKGGANLGSMLANAQQGVDLNKPTGRIYTASDLIAVLHRVYEKTSGRAEAAR